MLGVSIARSPDSLATTSFATLLVANVGKRLRRRTDKGIKGATGCLLAAFLRHRLITQRIRRFPSYFVPFERIKGYEASARGVVGAKGGGRMAKNEDSSDWAFANVFAAHWRHIVQSARAPLGSADEAEDAVSTAFTRAFAHRASFDARRASLPTWVAAIVRHEVIDRLRRRARLPMVGLAAAERLASGEDVAATVAQHDALAQALTRLPARDRQVLALRFGQGLTNREIARLLDADERTVSVWVLRALRRLRPLIDTEECAG